LPAEAIGGLLVEFPEIEIALSQLVSDRLGHRTQDALCGKSLGGYRLRHCISRGAMGVVYAVERQSDGSPHALKMLRHRFIYTPRVVQRFEQEAEFLRKLSHPNIVSIEDHFVEFRTRFIVLQLYDGCDLQSLVRRHGPLSESAARGILGQVAAGLRYAHANGVLHLDLKPANVLVNRLGQVAITDFGLGRLADSSEGDTELVGTPLYMPPEQFSMRDVGPHSDWYAFGCIAYELLRGERLFQTQAFRHLLEEKRRTPSTTWPDVQASEEYRLLLKTSLQPLVDHRELDLDLIASWARPVPELAPYLETPPPTAPISTKPR
jgi:serine/threonine protein kinase